VSKRIREKHAVAATAPTIVGTGLIALDLVISADSSTVRAWSGGTCGNVVTAMSFLGWKAYAVARLNADVASVCVKEDMRRWGVNLDYAECAPTCSTPILIQKIERNTRGEPIHRFAWNCPHCGTWLPGYKAVRAKAAEEISRTLTPPRVFFLDRLSRGALVLAKDFAARNALIVFEPSSRSEPRLFREALQTVHILKYAEARRQNVTAETVHSAVLLEVQTLGSRGLRYRLRPNTHSRFQSWRSLPAMNAGIVRDTCGAGDWCTAGILCELAMDGLPGFRRASEPQVQKALRLGQAMAAWTCAFEGARGGMYYVSRKKFWNQIESILRGKSFSLFAAGVPIDDQASRIWLCPTCGGKRGSRP